VRDVYLRFNSELSCRTNCNYALQHVKRTHMHDYRIFLDPEQTNFPQTGQMCDVGKQLGKLGSVPSTQEYGLPRTSGNFSMRVDRGFIITASGVEKTKLKSNEIVFVYEVDDETKKIMAKGTLCPSIDVLIHQTIYRSQPSINAILHTHDYELLVKGILLGIVQTHEKIVGASRAESEEISALINQVYFEHGIACITIRDHGQLFVGSSLKETIAKLEELKARSELLVTHVDLR